CGLPCRVAALDGARPRNQCPAPDAWGPGRFHSARCEDLQAHGLPRKTESASPVTGTRGRALAHRRSCLMSSPEVSREELLLDLARRLDDCLIEARDLLVQRGVMKRKYRETGIKNEDAWHRVNAALRQAQ